MPFLRHRMVRMVLPVTAVLLSVLMVITYYYRGAGPLSEPTTIVFKKGMGFEAIVDSMADNNVIRFPLVFKVLAVAMGDARQFKAGEYRFTAAISPKLVMDMIAHGRVVVRKITVPEGYTVKEIIALLDAQEALSGSVTDYVKEGSLLPQTYHYSYGDSREELIVRMREAMHSTLAELWPTRAENLPLKDMNDAVTLASIVEKETGIAEERGRVAAVFTNRLRRNMKLQSDPTVIYAVEQKSGPLKRALTRADLRADSPYNTYRYFGLPPAPIANPGRKSIEAVLNPPASNEYYFVATGNGGHHFSETLKQHNEFVKQYRKVLQQKQAQ
ncbi:MAG: endolytic transglycosylase MltG [Alphaproteobacteria bacterium]